MAHHVYHTNGIIIESSNIDEANKRYSIFTEDLGLIKATAQGVRYLKSKLRFTLQPFSLVKASLVRGKSTWRIVNAEEKSPYYQELKGSREKLAMMARVLLLLRRLVHGEEKNQHLYAELGQGFLFLKESDLSKDDVRHLECILLLRVLRHLGYFGKVSELDQFIEGEISLELISKMSKYRTLAVANINASLKETQL